MESQPQNPEFRINPKNFHPSSIYANKETKIDDHLAHAFKFFIYSLVRLLNFNSSSVMGFSSKFPKS